MSAITTSARGIAYIERIEGVVLKAYLCPAGKWTIGGGLTKASGVIDPKPGMVITSSQATHLMEQALARNYEPAVIAAMPGANQHEFDGGVSFHWNTGGINRASWVKAWRAGDKDAVKAKLKLWVKGGGKVLPGLVRRREEEFRIIAYGVYPGVAGAELSQASGVRWAVPMLDTERAEVVKAFGLLGYVGSADPMELPLAAVTKFQRDHDLTVDGIIGRATLSTLQRRLDAARKSKSTAAGGGLATGATELGQEGAVANGLAVPDWALWVAFGVVALLLLRLAWSYRDVIATKVQNVSPGLARFLRRY